MVTGGWIQLHRKIQHHEWLWPQNRQYTELEAWIDLLLKANHAFGRVNFGGEKIEIERGELITSEVKLAERWKWSRGKVRRFLNELVVEKMCVKNGTSRYTALRLINYGLYQGDRTSRNTGYITGHGTSDRTQTKKEKELIRNKNREKLRDGTYRQPAEPAEGNYRKTAIASIVRSAGEE